MKMPCGKMIHRVLVVCVLTGNSLGTAYAADLTGKVLFEGEAPAPKSVNFGAEKQCAMMHGDKMPTTEDLVVNSNKTVKWALVYVKEGAPKASAPAEALEIDQKGCMFIPHVAVAQAGQKVIFKNSDAVLHNVRSESKINKAFNIAQPIQGMTSTKIFAEPETGIKMRCDVHFWMTSYVHVLGHSFYGVTGDDGSFKIKGLPAGTYTVEVWHEKLGAQTAQVTVAESENKVSDFTFVF